MPNLPVRAAGEAMPAAIPDAGFHEILDGLELALDVGKQRPDTPDEAETRRYLLAAHRYALHLAQKGEGMAQQPQRRPHASVLHEIHDCLVLALDASERPRYSRAEREARRYLRDALKGTRRLMGEVKP